MRCSTEISFYPLGQIYCNYDRNVDNNHNNSIYSNDNNSNNKNSYHDNDNYNHNHNSSIYNNNSNRKNNNYNNNNNNNYNYNGNNNNNYNLESNLFMSSMTPIRLELYLANSDSFRTPGNSKKGGKYGVKCNDLISLTFYIIHSIRSVTFVNITKNIPPQNVLHKNVPSLKQNKIYLNEYKNEDGIKKYADNGTKMDDSNTNFQGYEISKNVNEGCLGAVSAHVQCVVLPVIAEAMKWYIHQLFLPSSSSSSSFSSSFSSSSSSSSSFSHHHSRYTELCDFPLNYLFFYSFAFAMKVFL